MEKTPSFDHLLIPDEAQDLHNSVGMTAEEEGPHLFVSLPKVVWVHIYGLLDVPTLFRAQRVCVRWRNLVNQPICWFSRAQALTECERKLRSEQRHAEPPDYAGRDWSEDEGTASVHDDDEITVFCGPASVAALKRQCKTLFVKQAVLMQHFEPRDGSVAALLEGAAAVADELKEAMWSEAWALEPCGKIAFERGRFYENLERYQESVQHYGLAVQQCPWDHGVRTRLGLTYHKWGKLEEALRNYLKTAALAPNYQLAWNNAGSIFFNTGFFERAKTCFTRCVLLDKRAGVAYNNRGLCHFLARDGASAGTMLARGLFSKCDEFSAVTDFTTAFHLNQGDKTARSNRAAAFNLIGDHAAAVQDCLAELARTRTWGTRTCGWATSTRPLRPFAWPSRPSATTGARTTCWRCACEKRAMCLRQRTWRYRAPPMNSRAAGTRAFLCIFCIEIFSFAILWPCEGLHAVHSM